MVAYSSRIYTYWIKVTAWLALLFACMSQIVFLLSLLFKDSSPIYQHLGEDYLVEMVSWLFVVLIIDALICRFSRKLVSVSFDGLGIRIAGMRVSNIEVDLREISFFSYTFGRVTINNENLYFTPQKDFIKFRAYFITSKPKNRSILELKEKINELRDN